MGNKKEKIFNNLLNLLEENQKLSLPIKVSKGTIKEDWIDYNGHMNMAYYVQCFEESCDYILELLELGHKYALEEKKGVFVIKCKIDYREEITLNEKFKIYVSTMNIEGKKLILDLTMLNVDDKVIANYHILNLNVDLITKKSCNFSNSILDTYQI
jgi:acyl-CoA thioester hydrolase